MLHVSSVELITLQVEEGVTSIPNIGQSRFVIDYYCRIWLDLLPLWSLGDPRRDPVRNVAAGVQEAVIGWAKQRALALEIRSVIEFIKWLAVGLGDQPAYLLWDATRFASCHIQYWQKRRQTRCQPEDEGIWKRPTVDRQLGSALKTALKQVTAVLKDHACGVELTWKQLCNPDPRQPLTTLLQACFELSGGSQLSGKAYSAAWGKFTVSRLNVWASTATLSGTAAKKAMMDTANNHQIRMTLQLFANSIHSDVRIVLRGLQAFKLHAASRIESTRAQVEVRSYVDLPKVLAAVTMSL